MFWNTLLCESAKNSEVCSHTGRRTGAQLCLVPVALNHRPAWAWTLDSQLEVRAQRDFSAGQSCRDDVIFSVGLRRLSWPRCHPPTHTHSWAEEWGGWRMGWMPVHIVGAIYSLVLPDTEPTASILPKKYESTRRVGSKCERLIEIFHVFPFMVARYLEQLTLCFCVCDFLIQILTEKMRYVQAPQEYQCHADCFLS